MGDFLNIISRALPFFPLSRPTAKKPLQSKQHEIGLYEGDSSRRSFAPATTCKKRREMSAIRGQKFDTDDVNLPPLKWHNQKVRVSRKYHTHKAWKAARFLLLLDLPRSVTQWINHAFISFSAVQIYELSYIHLHSSSSTGILRTHKMASSQLA